jgi:hypothetical protein
VKSGNLHDTAHYGRYAAHFEFTFAPPAPPAPAETPPT